MLLCMLMTLSLRAEWGKHIYIWMIFILFVQYFSSVLWRKRSRIGKKPSLTQVKNSEKVETTHTATELCMLCLSGTNTIPQCHDLKNNSWTLSPWHAVTENNQGGGRKCWFFFSTHHTLQSSEILQRHWPMHCSRLHADCFNTYVSNWQQIHFILS